MQQLLGMRGRLFVTLGFVAVDQWPHLPGLGPHCQTTSSLTELPQDPYPPTDCMMGRCGNTVRYGNTTRWSWLNDQPLSGSGRKSRRNTLCLLCPYCSFFDSHLISTEFVIAERHLKRAFLADFSQVEKRRMSWDLILRRATSWYLLIRHRGMHKMPSHGKDSWFTDTKGRAM